MRSQFRLNCIYSANGKHCDKRATWLVWYKSTGPVYTYACDYHLALRLLEPGDERITQLEHIEYAE